MPLPAANCINSWSKVSTGLACFVAVKSRVRKKQDPRQLCGVACRPSRLHDRRLTGLLTPVTRRRIASLLGSMLDFNTRCLSRLDDGFQGLLLRSARRRHHDGIQSSLLGSAASARRLTSRLATSLGSTSDFHSLLLRSARQRTSKLAASLGSESTTDFKARRHTRLDGEFPGSLLR